MRIFKIFLVFVALTFGMAPEMKLKKVSEDIYMVRGVDALPSQLNRGFMSNAAAVLTKEGWVVIDALTTPELSKEFVDNLMRVKKAPILYAVITHYHIDHYYGVRTYKEMGTKIIAHEKLHHYYMSGRAEQDLYARKERMGSLLDDVKLYPPDIVVKDRYSFNVGGKNFEIISMAPAHTDSDIVIYMPKEKVLFVGDLVYMNRTPFLGDPTSSSKGWVKSLEGMKKMDVNIIISGHNDILKKDALDYTMVYINYLRSNIKKMKEEDKFIDEIKQTLMDSPYKDTAMYNFFHGANIEKVFNELDTEEL